MVFKKCTWCSANVHFTNFDSFCCLLHLIMFLVSTKLLPIFELPSNF